jgi:predicted ATPase/DNA-binding CsgD family transcriptional regulator
MSTLSPPEHAGTQPELVGSMTNTPSPWPDTSPPQPLTPLIGREGEIRTVCDLLLDGGTRLLTLTGPGGVGKTRLALESAEKVMNHFADGVIFVDLAPLADAALIAQRVAQALGVQESSDELLVERLRVAIGANRLLLLLDNFEHVVEAAPLVAELLAGCPQLKILVTSRVRLRLSCEQEFVVPSLSMPERSGCGSFEGLAASEAVQLFVKRAQAVQREYALTVGNAPAVIAVCRRLDGLPLAIELAAARVKVLPPQAMLKRLEQNLPLPSAGARDMPARQQTIHDTIAWSHDLLTPAEQILFRRLAVFIGGCSLEAAEAVATPTGKEIIEGLASLVDQSLLKQAEGADGEPRYWMLETVREYGLERLAASGEEAEVRDRHAAWYLSIAEVVGDAIWQREDPEAIARLEADVANLRVALSWLAQRGAEEALLHVAAATGFFWYLTGRTGEGRAMVNLALSMSPTVATPAGIRTLNWAGLLTSQSGDSDAAFAHFEQAAGLARDLGLPDDEATANNGLGYLQEDQGNYDAAEASFLAARDHFMNAGHMFVTHQTYHLGIVAYGKGEIAKAKQLWEQAIVEAHAHGKPVVATWCLEMLGFVAAEQGELGRAAAALRECLDLSEAAAYQNARGHLLGALAVLGTACHLHEAVARLLGAAQAAHGRAFDPPEGLAYARAGAQARNAMGAAAYERAFVAGRDQQANATDADAGAIIAAAMSAAASTSMEHGSRSNPHGLTPREQEVLRLLGAGHTNEQIGEALFISPRTAQTHITHLLAKLGLTNRTEAASFAHRHHLD